VCVREHHHDTLAHHDRAALLPLVKRARLTALLHSLVQLDVVVPCLWWRIIAQINKWLYFVRFRRPNPFTEAPAGTAAGYRRGRGRERTARTESAHGQSPRQLGVPSKQREQITNTLHCYASRKRANAIGTLDAQQARGAIVPAALALVLCCRDVIQIQSVGASPAVPVKSRAAAQQQRWQPLL
jgi:hypothetical protein